MAPNYYRLTTCNPTLNFTTESPRWNYFFFFVLKKDDQLHYKHESGGFLCALQVRKSVNVSLCVWMPWNADVLKSPWSKLCPGGLVCRRLRGQCSEGLSVAGYDCPSRGVAFLVPGAQGVRLCWDLCLCLSSRKPSHCTWLRNCILCSAFTLSTGRLGHISKRVNLSFAVDTFSSKTFISCSPRGSKHILPVSPPSSQCASPAVTTSRSHLPPIQLNWPGVCLYSEKLFLALCEKNFFFLH